jgi:hypothetical protein
MCIELVMDGQKGIIIEMKMKMKMKMKIVEVMKGRGNVCTYCDASCEGVECRGFLTEELCGRHAAI